MMRAIPIQYLPYQPFANLLPLQAMFNYTNIVETLVDIRSPAFVTAVHQ
jgi:hypothetical protein